MKMYTTTQSVDKYLNKKLECSCGKTHYAPIKAIRVCKEAIRQLPDYVRNGGYKKPYIICDKNTYEIAAKECGELLIQSGLQPTVHIIRHMGFDEATLGEIVINKPDDCDLMIGCGTGSITDMLRYSSFKLGLPCFTVATGAPMDGFSASVGIMNVNNLKATMPAHSSEVIIGDTDILAGAPYRMSIAGFGDLVAKLNAINDWRIAVIANNDHYCYNIDNLVMDYVNDIISKAEDIRNRKPQVLGELMNALLLTGATISLYGNSRPISGAEHHMSHYWEVLGEQRGKEYAMHGEQAAIGTVLALMLAEELRETEINFDAARESAKLYDAEQWKREVRSAYGNAAETVIELEASALKNDCAGRLERIGRIESRWDEIKALLDGVYPSAELRRLLKDTGCPANPIDIGISAEVLKDTFMYCKETRARYTILQLAWDLDLLDRLSDKVIEKLKAMQAV